jgi:hypothetical protein
MAAQKNSGKGLIICGRKNSGNRLIICGSRRYVIYATPRQEKTPYPHPLAARRSNARLTSVRTLAAALYPPSPADIGDMSTANRQKRARAFPADAWGYSLHGGDGNDPK